MDKKDLAPPDVRRVVSLIPFSLCNNITSTAFLHSIPLYIRCDVAFLNVDVTQVEAVEHRHRLETERLKRAIGDGASGGTFVNTV